MLEEWENIDGGNQTVIGVKWRVQADAGVLALLLSSWLLFGLCFWLCAVVILPFSFAIAAVACCIADCHLDLAG